MPLVAAWKDELVGKVQEQGDVFSDNVTTQSIFAAFKTHFGYTFTIRASGNILMWHCFHGLSIYCSIYMLDITYMYYNSYLSTKSCTEDRFEFHMACGQALVLGLISCQIAIYM